MNNTKASSLFIPLLQNRCVTLVLASTAMAALSGCTALSPATPEQAVQKRANAYWQARVSGEMKKAYEFSTPSYRQLRSEAQFVGQFGAGASIESAEINKVECELEKCTVQVKIGVKPAIPGLNLKAVAAFVSEAWVLENGNWWRYQEV